MTSVKIIQANAATSSFVKRLDIYFDESTGVITDIQNAKLKKEEVDFYYTDDCLLFAGMGDIHIHAREDVSGKNTYKEDFHSACCAAINGGVIHVGDMPNNPIPPVDNESYLAKYKLTQKHPIPILLYAGIGPATRPLSIKVPYKAYMGPSIGELFFKDNQSLDDVLEYYRNQWVSFHCEDPEILEAHKGESTHNLRRPISAELMATDTALHLIEKYNLKGKLCHYSAGKGLDAIVAAKKKGVNVTCEVTPQHLYFSIDKLQEKYTDITAFQMNPPLRSEEDRQTLLAGLKNGLIDYLATDHAPHAPDEKQKGTSGLTGLDTYVPFVSWLLLKENVSAQMLARVCSEGPGRFINEFLVNGDLTEKSQYNHGLGKGLGFLEVGFSASFTVLNLVRPTHVKKEFLKTKAQSSPFEGEVFPGSVESVIYRGKFLSE